MSLHEVSDAAKIIQEAADPDANIIFGTVINPAKQGGVKVTVIATGFLREHGRVAAVSPEMLDPATIAAEEGAAAAEEPDRYLRRGLSDQLDFDASDEGFTPNFGKMKDDLDVPAFLRKQMD
jgi:cell division protein FtsZ